MLPQLVRLKGAALDFIFPPYCVGCGREGAFICPVCRQSLPRIIPPVCPRCGRPHSSGVFCPDCIRWQADIDGIRSPFRFEGVMREAIHQLKYQNLRALAAPLARMLQEYLIASPLDIDVLVPVPLHRKRLRERGYNQTSLLAKELGKLINTPVVDDVLVRQRHTPPQARTATIEERTHNIADAFACRGNGLRGRRVLLLDDVATSGTTLDACATVLKANGVDSVWGLVMAREI
ncbi:MAG TPA: ComF family protein [Dehalococcoidales bacterium]|nr:ComF family protein [Dehalococcoidales bacterium]